jgi:tRNA-specific 2-thiouridylase
VDSAASAHILKNQGYNVFGITMKLFESYDTESASYVAQKLNINHYIINLEDVFKKEVIDIFVDEYLKGKTPNPCIICNRKLKYGILLEEAQRLGADYMASGHYANVEYNREDCKYHLFKGNTLNKDQSYFLYHLKQKQLSRLIMPLANYESKDDVRNMVKDILPQTFTKRDSLNICFIQNSSYKEFIHEKTDNIDAAGSFIDKQGNFLGYHKGIYNYTIGQKRGLDIEFDGSMYVVQINSNTNEIILGNDEDTYKNEIYLQDVTYIDDDNKNIESFDCEIKLCQWGYYIKCTIYNTGNNNAAVKFHKGERAPAPGQSAVFYRDNEVLGGGIIL